MLRRDPSVEGGVAVHAERTMAMISLTVIHDVMKVEAILPVVAAEHAPYEGFKEADRINDHDQALGRRDVGDLARQQMCRAPSSTPPGFQAVEPSA